MYISWGGHKKIVAGCSTGAVIVWDIEAVFADNRAKDENDTKAKVLLSMLVLDAAVSSITWNGIQNPSRLVMTGYDGRTIMVDTEDPSIPFLIMRSRNMMKSCAWASHSPAFVFTDNDNVSRAFAMTEDSTTRMTKYGETPGFCWHMAMSEHHGQFALATSLGWLKTSNLYYVRLRRMVSFFFFLFKNKRFNNCLLGIVYQSSMCL